MADDEQHTYMRWHDVSLDAQEQICLSQRDSA